MVRGAISIGRWWRQAVEQAVKDLERTVVLEAWTNSIGRQALRGVEEAYRGCSRRWLTTLWSTEHLNLLYTESSTIDSGRSIRGYPRGSLRDASRRAKSFRELKKGGIARTEKPEIKRVTVTFSDSQDWRLGNGVIEVRTHRGWIELHYRGHRHLYRYLYSGWRLAEELRLKLANGRILIYLTFEKDFEVIYNPRDLVAVDVNENNVTLAVFRGGGSQRCVGLKLVSEEPLSHTPRGGLRRADPQRLEALGKL